MAEARAEGDEVRAGQNVADAEQAETDARDRFHESERSGFRDAIPEGELIDEVRAAGQVSAG